MRNTRTYDKCHEACGGWARIWGCCCWSGLASATFCTQRMSHLSTWIYSMICLFHQWSFSSLMAPAYSEVTMPGFIGRKLWKSGWGSMGHDSLTWIGPHRVQTLTPFGMFGMHWRRLHAFVRISPHQSKMKIGMQLWTEIKAMTLQKLVEMMPQPINIRVVDLFWPDSVYNCRFDLCAQFYTYFYLMLVHYSYSSSSYFVKVANCCVMYLYIVFLLAAVMDQFPSGDKEYFCVHAL